MIFENKKLFLNSAFIVLEDSKISEILRRKKYSSIIIISHTDLNLPSFKKRVKTTTIINLKNTKDDIFAKFNDTARNEIRKTYKIPNLEIVLDDKNFSDTYVLYKNFEYAQKRVPFSRKNLEKCLRFSAYYNGEIISGIFVDLGEKDLRIRYIFSKRLQTENKELYKIIASATRRLLWEICIWGKDKSFNSLDLASVNFSNPEVANITKFKMSFGGEVINEYTYTHISPTYSFLVKLVGIKLFLKKIFNK